MRRAVALIAFCLSHTSFAQHRVAITLNPGGHFSQPQTGGRVRITAGWRIGFVAVQVSYYGYDSVFQEQARFLECQDTITLQEHFPVALGEVAPSYPGQH